MELTRQALNRQVSRLVTAFSDILLPTRTDHEWGERELACSRKYVRIRPRDCWELGLSVLHILVPLRSGSR